MNTRRHTRRRNSLLGKLRFARRELEFYLLAAARCRRDGNPPCDAALWMKKAHDAIERIRETKAALSRFDHAKED